MDVHKESISFAVRNAAGKVVMECAIEAKASMILQFIDGLRGDVHVTFEEGTWAAWLYDLLKPRVTRLVAGTLMGKRPCGQTWVLEKGPPDSASFLSHAS